MILAISGTPCTGKTEVGRLLAKKLKWELISLNDLAEEKGFYCGYDRKRKTRVVDVSRLEEFLKKNPRKNLIIESHYAHEIKNDLTVVLRTNPKELRKRMARRGWSKEKIEENIQAEIMEICLVEAKELKRKVREVDTTGRSVQEVVEEISGLT
jgi:adenylate kinase